MAIASQTKPVTNPRKTASSDAIKLLRQDHKEVSDMFDEYERLRSSAKKRALADKICRALEIHTTIEEEVFYPAVRKALKLEDLLDEAEVEHASAKELIAQIRTGSPEDELFDAKVKVLGEYIKHHVKEEQNEMFPKVSASRVDTVSLGEQLAARKEELLATKGRLV